MVDARRATAEKAIQKILIDLEETTGQEIAAVEIDTREFSGLRVDILFAEDMLS